MLVVKRKFQTDWIFSLRSDGKRLTAMVRKASKPVGGVFTRMSLFAG